MIAEGVESSVEHGGGRYLKTFYDLPWVPNEEELREVRETLADAYLNPEKYEAERGVFEIVNNVLRTPNDKLSKEDKFFKEVTIKALKGDTKALEQVQNYFNERQYDYSIAYDVLSGKRPFEQLFVSSLENAKIKDQFLEDVKKKATNYSFKLSSSKDLKIKLLIGSF